MRIRETRLPLSQVASLQELSIQSVESFRPLMVPVYLLLEKNQKLISIKAPFDFFTPEEFNKFGNHNKLYLSPFVEDVTPFVEAAFEIRQALEWSETGATGALGPTSYEISDSVLRILAKLWAEKPWVASDLQVAEDPNSKSKHIGIESFFLAAFANRFCDPLPAEWIQEAHASDVELYEQALLKSGAMIFFALHLGYLDFAVLNRIYRYVFAKATGIVGDGGPVFISKELQELQGWIDTIITTSDIQVISSDLFLVGKNRASQKLQSRLFRIRHELMNPESKAPSVYGEKGIYDV
jgi:hypothetical protein